MFWIGKREREGERGREREREKDRERMREKERERLREGMVKCNYPHNSSLLPHLIAHFIRVKTRDVFMAQNRS